MNIIEYIAKKISPNLMTKTEAAELVKIEIASMASIPARDYDPKSEGYRRLSTDGKYTRELTNISQDRMFEVAYYLFDSSPLLRRIALLQKEFIFGENFSCEIEDENIKSIIDVFWNDNNLKEVFPDWMMWLDILGEHLSVVNIDPISGKCRLQYIDPALIKDVVLDMYNNPVKVILLDQGGKPGPVFNVIRVDENVLSPTYGKMQGDCFFFTINKPPNSKRGRSAYLTLFDWIDKAESHGFTYLERAASQLNFVWDVLVKNADPKKISEYQEAYRNPPRTNTVNVHNEAVEWKAVSPDIKSMDIKAGFDMALSFILGSIGIPSAWYGEGGKAYQTEADQYGQVPMKAFDEKQEHYKRFLEYIIQFVIDQAIIHNMLREKD